MFQLTGKLRVKKNTQQVTDSFKKREFVITDESTQYAQHVLFQLTQDKCDLLDAVNEGDEVKVSFNLRGREWTSPKDGEVKFFNSLDAWKIESMNAGGNAPMPETMPNAAFEEAPDDLPF